MSYWLRRVDSTRFRVIDWLRDFKWMSEGIVDRWHFSEPVAELRPDDQVFIWTSHEGVPGLYAQARVVQPPDRFPLSEREVAYFVHKGDGDALGDLPSVAVVYTRISLGAPVTEEEMRKTPLLREVVNHLQPAPVLRMLPEPAGVLMEKLMRGRSTLIDLPYCRT